MLLMNHLFANDRVPAPKNASAAAAEAIRGAILDGRLEAGARLKEGHLATELGFSRTPVREALLILRAEGLIELTPNRGARVTTFAIEEIEDLYEMRALLEGFAARKAALRISRPRLKMLKASCVRFEKLRVVEDPIGLVKENLFFHNTVLEAAGSSRLSSMVKKVIELPLVYRSFIWYSPDQRLISEHYHKQLVHAFETKDAERADLIMTEHVLEARDFLATELRKRAEQFSEGLQEGA